jgi:prepilin-type N-terminal cleavage/methylation domain-containing protein
MCVKRGEAGFSLIEMLVSIALIGILLGAIFTMLIQNQQKVPSEQDLSEATQNARLAMEIMSRVIRQAGNDLQRRSNDPCHPNNHPCISGEPISGTVTTLHIRSDITGSARANTGDPDCATTGPFEDVSFQYNASTKSIDMRLGAGGPYDPIAKNIAGLTFEYYTYDNTGTRIATTTPCQIRVVRITMVASASRPDAGSLGHVTSQYAFSTDVQLRNRK